MNTIDHSPSTAPGCRSLRLVDPTPALEAPYRDLLAEFAGQPPPFRTLTDYLGLSPDDFPAMVARLNAFRERADGSGMGVPFSAYWLVADTPSGPRLLGESNLRHRLSPELLYDGGHIGYMIRPSARGQGYGTRILALTLEQARAQALPRVLVVCADDNPASARVIERNGGVLENKVPSMRVLGTVRRYWIDLED